MEPELVDLLQLPPDFTIGYPYDIDGQSHVIKLNVIKSNSIESNVIKEKPGHLKARETAERIRQKGLK